jgi:hypothetical protein
MPNDPIADRMKRELERILHDLDNGLQPINRALVKAIRDVLCEQNPDLCK